MSYRVAAIDIHKKVLMVVVATAAEQVADAAGEALEFECRRFGAGSAERQQLVAWLQERGVTREPWRLSRPSSPTIQIPVQTAPHPDIS